MKNINKGIMVTTTIAAAIAAMTLAGCGKTADEIVPKAAPASVAAAVKPAAEKQTEVKADEKTEDEKSAAAKEEKKDTAKKDTAKKDTKKSKKSKKSKKTEAKKAAAPAKKAVPNAAKADPKDTTPAPAQAPKTETAKKTEAAKNTETKKTEKKAAPAKTVDFDKFTAVWEENDVYAGTYYQTEGTGVMEVKNIGNNTYAVRISTPAFKDQFNVWEFVGEFDGRAAMNYTDCRMTVRTVGSDQVNVVYTNGRGYIKYTDEIVWNDYEGYGIADTVFSLGLPEAAGGGSDNGSVKEVKAKKVEKKSDKEYVKPVFVEDDIDPEIELEEDEPDMTEFPFEDGTYFDGNGTGAAAEIRSLGGDTFECTIKVNNSIDEYYEYTFTALLDGDTLSYYDGEQYFVTLGDDGDVANRGIVDEGHFGTIRNSNTGLVWTDSDGSSFVFVK